ncbi:MAG TPA: polysaccharide biosynthesis/export family protein [Candidatus Acidoferrales bacterium]|nr:polysaccharide biosynthesis/export family protein [Candidatus Acidoferrales bacterium]
MRKLIGFNLLLGLALAAAVSAQESAQTKQTEPPKQDAKPQAPATAAKPVAATTDPNYQIGADDMLDVSVWNEPQISRSVPVRPDGKISLPLLEDIQAAGLTPTQLGDHITEGLKKTMKDPQVTVIVTAVNSRRYYVTGEVQRAGTYPLIPDMSALQALASAGGFTVFANRSKIYILRRDENGKQQRIPFDYDKVVKGKSQDVPLKAGDTIVIP